MNPRKLRKFEEILVRSAIQWVDAGKSFAFDMNSNIEMRTDTGLEDAHEFD